VPFTHEYPHEYLSGFWRDPGLSLNHWDPDSDLQVMKLTGIPTGLPVVTRKLPRLVTSLSEHAFSLNSPPFPSVSFVNSIIIVVDNNNNVVNNNIF